MRYVGKRWPREARSAAGTAGPAPGHIFNLGHGITPQTIRRQINDIIRSVAERDYVTVDLGADAPAALSGLDLQAYIAQLEKRMREAAANLEFEEAARLRDEIRKLEDKELGLATERRPSPSAPRAAGPAWKPASGSRDDKRRAAQAKSKARRRAGP